MNEEEMADLRSRIAELSSYPTSVRLTELIALATIDLPRALDALDALTALASKYEVIEYTTRHVHLRCLTCGRDFWDDAVIMAGVQV